MHIICQYVNIIHNAPHYPQRPSYKYMHTVHIFRQNKNPTADTVGLMLEFFI